MVVMKELQLADPMVDSTAGSMADLKVEN